MYFADQGNCSLRIGRPVACGWRSPLVRDRARVVYRGPVTPARCARRSGSWKAATTGRSRSCRRRWPRRRRRCSSSGPAALRDRLAEMEWLWEKLNWLRQARKGEHVRLPAGRAGRADGLVPDPPRPGPRGLLSADLRRPRRRSPEPCWPTSIPPIQAPGVTPGQVDHVLLVSGWFRKNPAEKAGLLTPAEAAAFEFASAVVAEPSPVAAPPERRRRKVANG